MLWNLSVCTHNADQVVPLIPQCWSLLSRRKTSFLCFGLKLRQTTFSIRVTLLTPHKKQRTLHGAGFRILPSLFWAGFWLCSAEKNVPKISTSGRKSLHSNSRSWCRPFTSFCVRKSGLCCSSLLFSVIFLQDQWRYILLTRLSRASTLFVPLRKLKG